MPRHVAIIMDGNGRWARRRGWDRTRGHRQGVDAVRAITTESVQLGIGCLTLYAFSSENWSRPRREVGHLMDLLGEFLERERPTLQENHVRLRAIGHSARLPDGVRGILEATCEATAGNQAMTLYLALSYGGRDEIVDACKALARRCAAGGIQADDITAADLQAQLYAPEAGDVDLVIRTAGEQRLSNFLLWQSVYAEYVSVPCFWPEFTVEGYHGALKEYQGRKRRFGTA